MASVIVLPPDPTEGVRVNPAGGFDLDFVVVVRPDAGGRPDVSRATVTVTDATTPSGLATALTTASRDKATQLGHSVPANAVLLMTFAKG